MGAFLEAGGTAEAFWRETPRTTMLAIQAYRRRRGWLAWNTAALQRFDFEHAFPSLEQMMGLPEKADEGGDEQLLFQVRKLKAFLGSGLKRSVH